MFVNANNVNIKFYSPVKKDLEIIEQLPKERQKQLKEL